MTALTLRARPYRSCNESPLRQGINEKLVHTFTTTPWGSNPQTGSLGASVMCLVLGTWTDYSQICLTTNAITSIAGDTLTLPALSTPTIGTPYRLLVSFLVAGNTESAYCDVIAER